MTLHRADVLIYTEVYSSHLQFTSKAQVTIAGRLCRTLSAVIYPRSERAFFEQSLRLGVTNRDRVPSRNQAVPQQQPQQPKPRAQIDWSENEVADRTYRTKFRICIHGRVTPMILTNVYAVE